MTLTEQIESAMNKYAAREIEAIKDLTPGQKASYESGLKAALLSGISLCAHVLAAHDGGKIGGEPITPSVIEGAAIRVAALLGMPQEKL